MTGILGDSVGERGLNDGGVSMRNWGRGGRRGGSERAEQSCGKGARTAATEAPEGAESVHSSLPVFAAPQRRLQ